MSISGTSLSTSFNVRGKGFLSISIVKASGTLRVEGLTGDDDAAQMRETEDALSYTGGAFGSTSVNVNSPSKGEVVIKLLEAHTDNLYMTLWYNQTKAGLIDPAIITFTSANYRDVAYQCLPVKFGDVQPAAGEDPGKEWRILASRVSLGESLSLEGYGLLNLGLEVIART